MPKYNVIHGSVTLSVKDGSPVVANVGDALELTEEQAKGLVATGFIADAEQFGALKQMVESAAKANALGSMDRKSQKLAAALGIRSQALVPEEPKAPEAPKSKGK
jgi:hypothetical protein